MSRDSKTTQLPSSEESRPPRPVSRWGVGTLTLFQLAFALMVLIGANFLAGSRPARRDLTEQQDYSLSQLSKRFIEEKIATRTEPVKMIVAFRRTSPFFARVRGLVEAYDLRSAGKIEIEFVDPVRSPNRAQTVADTYGIKFSRDLVIVDARSAEKGPAEAADDSSSRSGHIRFVSVEDMTLYETTAGQRRPIAFQGEDALTSALVAATEGTPRIVYLLADKSDLRHDTPESAWKNLATVLFQQNIHLISLNLSETERIPDDAEGIALIAPRYDLEPRELEVVEEYWSRPGSAVFVTLDPNHRPPRLRAFLRDHGVSWHNDRVVTHRAGQTQTAVRAVFTEGMAFTRDFWGQSTVFEGATSSLEVRENDESLLNRRISAYSLLRSTEDYWGETDFTETPTAFDRREDHAGPLTLAAAVIRGAATDEHLADLTSKMLILSNSAFLEPSLAREEQMDFVTSGMNWLIDRPALVGIGPRTLVTYKLPLLDAEISFINRVNLFFLPALILVLAAIVWQTRRA